MEYKLTKEEMGNMLKESGINFPEERPWLHSVSEWADRNINKPIEQAGIPHLGAGALSAIPHLAQNVANAPGALSNAAFGTNIPKMEIPKEFDPSEIVKVKGNSPTQQAMGMMGEIAGSLPAGGGAYNAAMKGLRATAKTPLIGRAAVAGTTGAALSDSDQFGGRGLGAALSALGPLVAGVSKTGLGKKANEIAGEYKGKFKDLYQKIISESEKAGASKHMTVPSILNKGSQETQTFFKHTPSDLNASVKRYISSPSFENAHKAQSDAGKIVRRLKSDMDKGVQLSSGKKDAYEIAQNIQNDIRKSMEQAALKSKNPKLANEYKEITKGYKEEVVPWKTPEMAKLEAGKGKANKAGESLLNSKDFAESEMAKMLPGYGARKAFHDVPPWLKWTGGIGSLYAAKEAGIPIPHLLEQLLEKQR